MRGKHGGKGNGCYGRGAYNDGYNPSQLLKHYTGHAAKHGKGNKYGNDNQRGGNYRYPHLIGGIFGRFAGMRAAFDMPHNVLQHHDGIVHHHTNGHSKGTEGNDIERTPDEIEVNKGDYKGNGNGKSNDERSPPPA